MMAIENNPKLTPTKAEDLQQFNKCKRIFIKHSLFIILTIPFICIASAYLIRSTNIQEWFYENHIIRAVVFIISLILVLSVHSHSNDKRRPVSYGWRVFFAFIPIVCMLVLLNQPTFNTIFYSTFISSIILLIYLYISYEKTYIQYSVVILLSIVPHIFIMLNEGIPIIIKAEEDHFNVFGYTITNNIHNIILSYGYCYLTVVSIARLHNLVKYVFAMPPVDDFYYTEQKEKYWIVRKMFIFYPESFGAYIGAIFSFTSWCVQDYFFDVDNLAQRIKNQ